MNFKHRAVFKRSGTKTRRFKDPVIVLGGNLTGLGVARTLGRRGIDVYLVVDRKNPAIFSKYCKKCFIATKLYDPNNLKNILKKIGKSLSGRAVVYPTSDLDALNLSRIKDHLVDDYHLIVGDEESVKILVDKSQFYRALNRSGISYPKTCFPENMENVWRIGKEIKYPIFIRPSISPLFTRVFGSGKGFIARSLKELISYYKLTTKYGIEVMFQEIIPGPPSNSYQLEGYYDLAHRPTVLFARQRLRIWPLDFGNTTLCVSIHLTRLAEEKEIINNFIKTIGYQGLMSAEFKKDARNGTFQLLEINARAWWHIWLSSRCGVDILFNSYLDAIGEKAHYDERYEIGVKSMYLLADLGASAKMLLNGDLSLQEWVLSVQGPIEFAFLRKEDLSPFIIDCATKIFTMLKQQLSGVRKIHNG